MKVYAPFGDLVFEFISPTFMVGLPMKGGAGHECMKRQVDLTKWLNLGNIY